MDELLIAQTASIEDLAGREGFDENFLGQRVHLPGLAGVETVLLPYTHFSVLMRLDKRLAVTGRTGDNKANDATCRFRYSSMALTRAVLHDPGPMGPPAVPGTRR